MQKSPFLRLLHNLLVLFSPRKINTKKQYSNFIEYPVYTKLLDLPIIKQNGRLKESFSSAKYFTDSFISFCNFNLSLNNVFHALCEFLSGISAIRQYFLHFRQSRLVCLKHNKCTISVSNIRSSYRYGVRKPLHIYSNVSFNARDFFSSIIPFSSAVSVFLTLCASIITKVVFFLSRMALSLLSNHFFLKPWPYA